MEPKKALTLLLILCFAVASIPEIVTVKAEPKTIVVPDDYASIQESINAASEGDIVFVKTGTYEEQTLQVTETVSLIGEDAINTIISLHPPWVPTGGYHLANGGVEPDYGYDNPIKVIAENVKISGFTIISNVSSNSRISGRGTQITDNYIETGLFLEYSRQNITGNVVRGGITCIGNNHTIAKNNVEYVWVMASDVIIEGNIIRDHAGAGISLGGYRSTVFNNTVENCKTGIAFWAYASNNLIYHNNFINNTSQVVMSDPDNPSVGKFDNGSIIGGNYWSDYLGTDHDDDGIGDSPYFIDASNQDNFPLMEPVETPIQILEYLIPEFPSWTILPLLLMATLVAIIYKRRLPKSPTN